MCLLDLSLILKLFTVVTCTFIIGSSTKTEVCLEKHFKNVIRGGSSLPAANIISSHNVQSLANCFMLCSQESHCVGFNYQWNKTGGKGVNCQLSNHVKGKIGIGNGEWYFYQDINKMNKSGGKSNEDKQPMSTERPHFYTTCTTLRQKDGSLPTGSYFLNPRNFTLSPSQVHCDMESKNGIGVTVIGHDSETRTRVDGYDGPASYSRKIRYNITMEQIVAVINQSKNCEQFIKYECSSSLLLYDSYGFWVSRQDKKMNYWGGAAVDSGKCACGMNDTCTGGGKCNCDVNDKALREDSGFLTDKNTLPVTELRFGDTGIGAGHDEHGYHTLGKFLCWG